MGLDKFKKKIAQRGSTILASRISKEDFLSQLKDQWRPFIRRDSDIDKEVSKARDRIERSDFKEAFNKVGITDEDLSRILTEIKEEKPEQVIKATKEIGRNELCPCGSGLKYKRCCGK